MAKTEKNDRYPKDRYPNEQYEGRLEELLRGEETAAPEPPAGLLEAIRGEIPAELPALTLVPEAIEPDDDEDALENGESSEAPVPFAGPAAKEPPGAPPLSRRLRPLYLLAATLAVAVIGGYLAWQVGLESPRVDEVMQHAVGQEGRAVFPAGPSRAAESPAPKSPAAEPPEDAGVDEEADDGDSLALRDDRSMVESDASTAPDTAESAAASPAQRQQLFEEMQVLPSPPPPPAAPSKITEMEARGSSPTYGEPKASPEGGRQSRSEIPRPSAKRVPIPDPTPAEPRLRDRDESTYDIPEVEGNRQVAPENQQTAAMRREAKRLESELRKLEEGSAPRAGTTGGNAEPNDAPYGDMFFRGYGTNPFIDTEEDRLSTFGLDVDTASYTLLRRYLRDGNLPPRDAVRVEEVVNYFRYGDLPPRPDEERGEERGEGRGGADFRLGVEGAPTPFSGPASSTAGREAAERYRLLRLSVKGREVRADRRPPAELVFVVDVSGSMNQGNRLGLVKEALGLLLGELRPDDRVGLVVYGSSGRVLLEPTGDKERIRRAIDRLVAEGSTNAEEGLRLAYDLIRRHQRRGAVHRVILCSDGVANVGRTGPESILGVIGDAARSGVELTTVGFGMGNYNDVLMEQLADQGDGRYAYVDDLGEARRIFVENLTGTLLTIATDAKIQVEFDPAGVERWRLLGYENRDVADHRFRDDTVDAGEIGAGHAVTALYEVKLRQGVSERGDLGELRLRYRSTATGRVEEVSRPIRFRDLASRWSDASADFQLAAVAAELAELLRGSYWSRGSDPERLFREAQRVSARRPGDLEVAELATLTGRAADLLEEHYRRSGRRPPWEEGGGDRR